MSDKLQFVALVGKESMAKVNDKLKFVGQKTVEQDCRYQQSTREDARQFGRLPAQTQSVLQNDNAEQSQHGAEYGATPPENRSTSEHDCRDRHQLVSGPGIRFRLSQMRHVNHGGQTRRQAG